jgi:hypothetical protein
MNRRAVLLLALTPLALIAILFALAHLPDTRARSAPTAPATPPPAAASPIDPDAAVLSSPQLSLEAASRALAAGDEARFRRTLLPAVAAQLTPDAFARCRSQLGRSAPQADWQRADRFAQDGHAVARVALGEQQVGFHQLDGKWLADRLWCAR